MKVTTKLLATSLLLALLAIGSAAQAETIYQASGGTGIDTARYRQWIGSGFTTDANSWMLNSVTLGMPAAYDTSGNFFVKLYNSVNGKPGTSERTLSGSANPATAGSWTYDCTVPYALSPSTSYWIVAGVSGGVGEYAWNFGSQNGSPTTGTNVGYTYSYNQGTTFDDVLSGDPAVMTIDATKGGAAVPEASTLVGFGSALAMAGPGLVGYLRRRRA